MHALPFIVWLGCLGLVACNGHTFSLEAKPRHDKRNFHSDWAVAHNRWGSKGSQGPVAMSSLVEGEGSIDAEPIVGDQAYVTEVEFGSPPQKLKMILDTGSSDVWVQSTDTMYRVNSQGPWAPRYNPDVSNSSERLDKAFWSVEYLDGTTATGIVYRDTVRLGSFHVQNATIQSAQVVAPRFELDPSVSGIMGLAKQLPNNIVPPTPSFLSILRPQLREPIFAVDLRRNASSRFFFGHVDASLIADRQGDLAWLDSRLDSPHWDVELELTAWRGKHPVWMYHQFQATLDTGTSLMFLPDPLASRYWLSVPGVRTSRSSDGLGGAYMFPCDQARLLPDLLFKLPGSDNRIIRVPGQYLNYGPLESEPSYCWGGMQSARELDVTVLGDVMLKAVIVAFDVARNRIGLANKFLDDLE